MINIGLTRANSDMDQRYAPLDAFLLLVKNRITPQLLSATTLTFPGKHGKTQSVVHHDKRQHPSIVVRHDGHEQQSILLPSSVTA